MRRSRFPFILLVSLFVVSFLFNVIFMVENYQRNRVVAVSDGDSIQLTDGRRVRLLGIDAPERDRCMATQAREQLKKFVLHKHVRLKDTVTDGYGRVLAIVIVEDFPTWIGYLMHRYDWLNWVIGRIGRIQYVDPLVNRAMLASGLARNTFSASRDYAAILKKASEQAKASSLGIYSSRCRTAPVADCTIKGNVRDGEKIYHVPGCDNYAQVIVDEAFGDAWFCTEGEAAAAGFTRASGCRK